MLAEFNHRYETRYKANTYLYMPSSGWIRISKCINLSFPSGKFMLVPLVSLSSDMSIPQRAISRVELHFNMFDKTRR